MHLVKVHQRCVRRLVRVCVCVCVCVCMIHTFGNCGMLKKEKLKLAPRIAEGWRTKEPLHTGTRPDCRCINSCYSLTEWGGVRRLVPFHPLQHTDTHTHTRAGTQSIVAQEAAISRMTLTLALHHRVVFEHGERVARSSSSADPHAQHSHRGKIDAR